jgi:hypothetical protein
MVYSLYLVITKGGPYDEWNYVVRAKSTDDAVLKVRMAGDQRALLSSTELDFKGPIIVSIHTGD